MGKFCLVCVCFSSRWYPSPPTQPPKAGRNEEREAERERQTMEASETTVRLSPNTYQGSTELSPRRSLKLVCALPRLTAEVSLKLPLKQFQPFLVLPRQLVERFLFQSLSPPGDRWCDVHSFLPAVVLQYEHILVPPSSQGCIKV